MVLPAGGPVKVAAREPRGAGGQLPASTGIGLISWK